MIASNEKDQYEVDEEIKKCIENVSQNQKYQLKLVIFFAIVALSTTIFLYSNGLFYMNPVFKCAGSDEKVLEDEACLQIDLCTIGK